MAGVDVVTVGVVAVLVLATPFVGISLAVGAAIMVGVLRAERAPARHRAFRGWIRAGAALLWRRRLDAASQAAVADTLAALERLGEPEPHD